MSSKSRKKQKGPEMNPEVPAEAEAEVAPQDDDGEVLSLGTMEAGESNPEIPRCEATWEEQPAREIPESVTEEALHAEMPAGDVPRLAHVIEAILFASQKAVSPKELVSHLRNAAAAAPESAAAAFAKIRETTVLDALEELRAEVAASGRAYQVRETATGWLLCSGPGFAIWLRALYPEAKTQRLSAPALETLAIIAYRQPITRADIEAVRGVAVDGVMQTILDRGLIKIVGRAETPGRPLLYSTTQYFLDHFGLRHLDELPNAAELRHIPLPKAAAEPEPADGSTAELPGMENGTTPPAGTAGEIEITEIMEVCESVAMEEVEQAGREVGAEPGDRSES